MKLSHTSLVQKLFEGSVFRPRYFLEKYVLFLISVENSQELWKLEVSSILYNSRNSKHWFSVSEEYFSNHRRSQISFISSCVFLYFQNLIQSIG